MSGAAPDRNERSQSSRRDPPPTYESVGDPTWPVVVFLVLLAAWKAVEFGAPYGGDWAQYMSHARAFVEGRPYSDIGYLFSPHAWLVGPPVYPPGLPLLLVPSIALFGDSTVVPRLMMHGLLALFLMAAHRYFTSRGERDLALGAVLLVGASFLLLDIPNVVGSDLGMCALVWGVFVAVDASDAWSWRKAAILVLLGAAALSFRLAAAPLVPALAVWALLRHKTVGLRPWLVAALWAAVLIYTASVFGPGDQASEAASQRLVSLGSVEQSPFDRGLRRLVDRILTYRQAASEAFLYPFPLRWANRSYHVAALLMSCMGIWGWARRRWSHFGVIFGAGTVAMLLILPVWISRYAWVLTPFLCYGLVRGVALALERMRNYSPQRSARLALLGVSCVVALATAGSILRSPQVLPDDATDWRALGQVLGDQGVDSPRAASNRPRMLTWYTGIPATGLPNADLDVFLDEVSRLNLNLVVVSTLRSQEPEFAWWVAWKRDQPEVFPLLARVGELEAFGIVPDALRAPSESPR